jgi:ADP-ribose pyrophosphatase
MESHIREAKIDKVSPLPTDEAKWIEFQKIDWTDQDGKQRVWESASRKTRGATGIDAVAIVPILLHPSRPTSTLVILQYRPPVQAICVEFPAGLIDAGETTEQTVLRELKEETGYTGKIVDMSPTVVCDPGMSTANMQFATVEVQLQEGDAEPEQHLDEGENIERVVVPLCELFSRLMTFSAEGKMVDARLFHWAAGMKFAVQNNKRYNLSGQSN